MLLNRKVHPMWDRNFDSCLEMLYYIHQKDKSNTDESEVFELATTVVFKFKQC